ncbi:MAG TPA: DUF6551 family protein [Nocardioides sp.]|uniref:DUF6551 family protein n=1 Tax=Nocardioides sp. TaxID=35761 RepID=UPI002EDAC8CE
MTTSIDLDAALDDVLEHEYDQPDGTRLPEVQEPYVTALPIEDLFADHTYQRELDEKRVVKMAREFRLALVGIVEVADRGPDTAPRYAILDGQHRWATVRDRSFGQVAPHLPCRVHTGLTIDQEAKLYHELNTTRKQLTGWDRWLARRGAGDPIVRDIEALLDRHGLVVSLRGGGNVFRATRTAEKLVELNGLPLLEEVIGITRAAWPDDQNGMDGHILHGLGHVLNAYTRDELDVERLITELAGILPRQLAARAAAVRELHKGTVDRLVGHVIVERYNVSKGPKLEAFFSRVKPVSKAKTTKAKYEEEYRAAAKAWASETRFNGSTYHARAGKALVAAFVAAGEPGAPTKPEGLE